MSEAEGAHSPEYERPPVSEVVLGVQFTPVEKLGVPQILKYAQRVRADFPELEEAPPLPPIIESYSGVSEEVLIPITPRVWFRAADGRALLQLQRDRFLGNWRKVSEHTPYARYKNISREFFSRLQDFTVFLADEVATEPHLRQYELTYINHVYEEEGWTSLNDLSGVFNQIRPEVRTFLPSPERIDYRSAFLLPDQTGRLHTRIHNGRRIADGKAVVLLELTARGFAGNMELWFQTAHDWIINAFEELTTPEARRNLWGKQS